MQVLKALRIALAAGLLAINVGCSKGTEVHPPPAPTMPAGWTVKADLEVPQDKIKLEIEYRLEGKITAVRNTIYEVHGKRVQLNTIVPLNASEGDKIFRILANKKAAYSYLRKGDLIYEFVAGNDATEEVTAARASLAQ